MTRDLVHVREHRLLADLVDDAAGRAAPEQHRRRAAQQLDPVEVEDVAVVERRVADVVDVDVAARRQREAAQADVLLAALGRLEGDAGGVVQRVASRCRRGGPSSSFSVRMVVDCGTSRRSWLPRPTVVVVARTESLSVSALRADGGRREHRRRPARRPPATAPTPPTRPAARSAPTPRAGTARSRRRSRRARERWVCRESESRRRRGRG